MRQPDSIWSALFFLSALFSALVFALEIDWFAVFWVAVAAFFYQVERVERRWLIEAQAELRALRRHDQGQWRTS